MPHYNAHSAVRMEKWYNILESVAVAEQRPLLLLRTFVLFVIDISAHLCYILRSAVMGAAVEGVMP